VPARQRRPCRESRAQRAPKLSVQKLPVHAWEHVSAAKPEVKGIEIAIDIGIAIGIDMT
jgi:hypothetical protein